MATQRLASASARGALKSNLTVSLENTGCPTSAGSLATPRFLKPWVAAAPILNNETGLRWKSTHAIGLDRIDSKYYSYLLGILGIGG